PIGVLLALSAGLMFALYTNCSKQLTEKEETLPAVAMTFSLCSVMLLPFSGDGVTWAINQQNLFPIVFMGLAATSLAYILFLAGLEKISSSSA
ncbi:EamA family transporter, partial [Pseudoalteromonas sp. SIMBA_162]|uniref:EamA family transporter n=1 Tax=Pseudoalteromonas sp. SIMBA_162 TaxID=3080867 RepID=UPI00397D73A5